MSRRLALAMALVLATPVARAEPACLGPARAAEAADDLPPGLLAAIGRVESGRADPDGGPPAAWPWSVNAAGRDHVFATEAQAIGYAAEQLRAGVAPDIGCFQISLQWHPLAFVSLREAFDPAANARYAADFLTGLHRESGLWRDAIARYHSATPQRGEAYADAVLRAWNGAPSALAGSRPVRPRLPVVWHPAARPTSGSP